MLLKFGTPCRSRGENLGTLHGVTLEPSEKLLLRAVVEEPQADPLVRRKVPFNFLDTADDDGVVLACTPDEFRRMVEHDPEAPKAGRRRSGRRRRGEEPPERMVTARTRVHCRDGEVGPLETVLVDSRTGELEQISFEFGTAVTREIAVAAAEIEEIKDDRITLRGTMEELESYPTRRS